MFLPAAAQKLLDTAILELITGPLRTFIAVFLLYGQNWRVSGACRIQLPVSIIPVYPCYTPLCKG